MAKFLEDCARYLHGKREDKTLGKKIMEALPLGSGFDEGFHLLHGESGKDKLVFETAYHHMNANGFYTHWTRHKVIFTPSFLNGYDVRVTGINYGGIKEYIEEVMNLTIQGYR